MFRNILFATYHISKHLFTTRALAVSSATLLSINLIRRNKINAEEKEYDLIIGKREIVKKFFKGRERATDIIERLRIAQINSDISEVGKLTDSLYREFKFAAADNDIEIVSLILNCYYINIDDDHIKDVLKSECFKQNSEMVIFLFEHEYCYFDKDDLDVCLSIALGNRNEKLVDYLVEKGASANVEEWMYYH